ncbi:MAG: nucleoside-diphosphate-sugar epimerase [Salibacteraceae bacterium]
MKTILITGINGYLGSHLAKRYSENYNIIGLEYSKENLFRLQDQDFEVFESKNGISDEIFKDHDVDCIIHTATFYGRDQESDSQMMYANCYLPQTLVEKAIKSGCSLFINTDTVLDRFTSSYALTKKQFRDWLQYYSKLDKMKVINLQLEHFYGPGTSSTNFITLMTQKMLLNESSIALTAAEQNRDFLYIDDLLQVYDLMLNTARAFSEFEVFNVGAGKNTNLKYILQYIKKHTDSSSILKFGALPYRFNELMTSSNDISKLKGLGWSPKTSVDLGLSKVIQFEKNKLS